MGKPLVFFFFFEIDGVLCRTLTASIALVSLLRLLAISNIYSVCFFFFFFLTGECVCVRFESSHMLYIKEIISRYDSRDPTSATPDVRMRSLRVVQNRLSQLDSEKSASRPLSGLRIGVPQVSFTLPRFIQRGFMFICYCQGIFPFGIIPLYHKSCAERD